MEVIGVNLQPVGVDGGSVMWLDESGKDKALPTNLLAAKSRISSTPGLSGRHDQRPCGARGGGPWSRR